jgi:hypothetical protein
MPNPVAKQKLTSLIYTMNKWCVLFKVIWWTKVANGWPLIVKFFYYTIDKGEKDSELTAKSFGIKSISWERSM